MPNICNSLKNYKTPIIILVIIAVSLLYQILISHLFDITYVFSKSINIIIVNPEFLTTDAGFFFFQPWRVASERSIIGCLLMPLRRYCGGGFQAN